MWSRKRPASESFLTDNNQWSNEYKLFKMENSFREADYRWHSRLKLNKSLWINEKIILMQVQSKEFSLLKKKNTKQNKKKCSLLQLPKISLIKKEKSWQSARVVVSIMGTKVFQHLAGGN